MMRRAISLVVPVVSLAALCAAPVIAAVEPGEIRPGPYRGESEQGKKIGFQLEFNRPGKHPAVISMLVRARACGRYRIDARAPVDERSYFEARDGSVDLYGHFVTPRRARGEFFIYDPASGCDTGAVSIHFKARRRAD